MEILEFTRIQLAIIILFCGIFLTIGIHTGEKNVTGKVKEMLDHKEIRQTIICICLSCVVVFGLLCILLYGFALLGHKEDYRKDYFELKANIDNLKVGMDNLEFKMNNHEHNYSTGKPRKGRH